MKQKGLLKTMLLLCALIVGSSSAWADGTSGTINFGSAEGSTKISGESIQGDDSQGNTWTITTVITNASFTQNAAYSQVGAAKKPATSITFTTTLPSDVNITAFSAKFGGFSGTAGTITLKVGDTTVGTGSLNATTDVTVSNTSAVQGKVLTVTVTDILKGVKCYNISYTYEMDSNKENITLSFPQTSYEVDVNETFEAPELNNDKGATITVTYASSDETVATVNAETGAVTLLAAGTTKITAIFVGNETYNAASAFYNLTVYDPTVKGTEYNPYTVEEAIEAIQALEKPASGISNAYVKGIVTKIDNIGSGALTYWISDDGINESQFEVYKGKSFGGAEFSSENDLEIGDIIVLKGKIVYYSKDNVYEFSSNSQIFSLKRNVAVTSAGWATYAATANMEFAEGDAFIVTAATTSATLTSVTKVPAGTPVILKGEGTKTATVLAEAPAAINGNMLKVGDGVTETQNPYVLANKTKGVGFYKWEGTLADLNGKVYLEFETPTDPNPARDFIGFAETTGINGVEKATVENGQFFNLAGQRVAQPTKGLYIVNGKKVIIK